MIPPESPWMAVLKEGEDGTESWSAVEPDRYNLYNQEYTMQQQDRPYVDPNSLAEAGFFAMLYRGWDPRRIDHPVKEKLLTTPGYLGRAYLREVWIRPSGRKHSEWSYEAYIAEETQATPGESQRNVLLCCGLTFHTRRCSSSL